ncbi:MAG: sigma-54-dependent Fis family transcriptional regulator, partial [Nitrospira sp.]
LEERTIRRVGSAANIPIDVRVMAATNRNLKEAVAKGEFREDLYFRLNVVTLTVPPLRERREDIIPLAEQFLNRSALALKKPVRTLGESAQVLLRGYHLPGNVRELSNLIERAVLFCAGTMLEASNFPIDVQGALSIPVAASLDASSAEADGSDSGDVHISFRVGAQSLADLEDRIIEEVLARSGGNKTLAAKQLGVTRWMLDRRRKPRV